MSRQLLLERLQCECKRTGVDPDTLELHILSHEDVEDFAPLNTPEGQAQIEAVIAKIGGVDFVIFDNIMSLTIGDMKDEKSWTETLPWVKSLTKRLIGQLWIHHTGHDETRSYGAKTKEWQLDTVIGLTAVEREDTDVSFKLSFGKARGRTPVNRDDFVDKNVALIDDRWVYEVAGRPASHITKLTLKFYEALRNATIGNGANKMFGHPAASLKDWQAECIMLGLLERQDGKFTLDHRSRSMFSRHRRELIAANRIACNDTMAWLTTIKVAI
jgi:hypothetical protein